MSTLRPARYLLACTMAVLSRDDSHRYNAQYSARVEGWEAARVRDLAAHTEKARHAFSSAGGDALARELVEKACPQVPCMLHHRRVGLLPAKVLA